MQTDQKSYHFNESNFRRKIKTAKDQFFDVIVMGGGVGGLTTARILSLRYPSLKIAVIDPLGSDRDNQKVGEALIEWSSCMLSRECDLKDYLHSGENHPYKHVINFHYIKDGVKNPTDFLEDYHYIFLPRGSLLKTWFVDRAKLETDLIEMNGDKGVSYFEARIGKVHLDGHNDENTDSFIPYCEPVEEWSQDKWKSMQKKMANNDQEVQGFHRVDMKFSIPLDDSSTEQKSFAAANMKYENEKSVSVYGQYVVDAAGKQFLIGSQMKNIIRPIRNIRTNAAWFRVKDFSKKVLEDLGFLTHCPKTKKQSSKYFSTNHLCNKGSYTWMIPLDNDVSFVSIGVTYYPDHFPNMSTINTTEKLLEFFKNEYKVLYDIIVSGEIYDFKFRCNLPYKSKKYYGYNRWSTVGDASAFLDPFTSLGIGMLTHQVTESVRLIEQHFIKNKELTEAEGKKDIVNRVNAYNRFFESIYDLASCWLSTHGTLLGHAEAMSASVAMGDDMYFSYLLPAFFSEKHLDIEWCNEYADVHAPHGLKQISKVNDTLLDMSKNPILEKYPCVWQFAFWNVIWNHQHYQKKFTFEKTDYGKPEECNWEENFSMYKKSSALCRGQLNTIQYGFFNSLSELMKQSKESGLDSVSQKYYYTMGCITHANPLNYAIFSGLPSFDPQFRVREDMFKIIQVAIKNRTIFKSIKKAYSKFGVPLAMYSSKPIHWGAFGNFTIRFFVQNAFLLLFYFFIFVFFIIFSIYK